MLLPAALQDWLPAGRLVRFSIDTVDEFWTLQFTLSSLARKRLQAIPSEAFTALRLAFDDQCNQHLARGGRLVYRSGALVATARRPG